MAGSSRSQAKLPTLKLLVDTKANKVLFAEASKDFVDFLFDILSLPVGTVLKLLTEKSGMVGSLGDLYKSVGVLSSDYLQPDFDKDSILKPKHAAAVPLLSLNEAQETQAGPNIRKFYSCPKGHCYFADADGKPCSYQSCRRVGYLFNDTYVLPKDTVVNIESSSSGSGSGGYVKGVVTYMITDSLEVKPTSAISGITLINKFRVQNVASLVEKEVKLGINEGLALLKASLETRAVLTTVFLGGKA